jgi:hypothetical protein
VKRKTEHGADTEDSSSSSHAAKRSRPDGATD